MGDRNVMFSREGVFFSIFLWLPTSILLCFSGDRRENRFDVGVLFFSS